MERVCLFVYLSERSGDMKFLNKLERKFGKYAIADLMKYVLVLYGIGTAIGFFAPSLYTKYLDLDFSMIARGQIWRLITFIMQPYPLNGQPFNIIFFGIQVYLYLMIGRGLEQAWGRFRFNLYFLSGILFNLLAGLMIHFVFHMSYPVGLTYILQSMFLAFAVLYPDLQLLLWFVIPIKIKWLGYLYGIILGYNIISCFLDRTSAGYVLGIAILISVANFLLFFLWSRKNQMVSPAHARRRKAMKMANRRMSNASGNPRHRCAICGRTEQDNPDLQFRFCSKCEGNFEYCNDHLFTHTHVRR